MDAQIVVNGKQARGMTMVIALVVVAVLLFVAVVLLSSAFGSAAAENSIRAKLAAFNAAQAGIDQVVSTLDNARGTATECANGSDRNTMGTLADGGTYEWCIEWNAIVSGPKTVRDHANVNNTITVPRNTVYAWSSGSGDGGGRGVLIEALIAPSTGIDLPSGAILAGGDVYVRGDVGVYASSPGADDPNRSTDRTPPSAPTQRSQPNARAASTPVRDGSGSCCAGSCRSGPWLVAAEAARFRPGALRMAPNYRPARLRRPAGALQSLHLLGELRRRHI